MSTRTFFINSNVAVYGQEELNHVQNFLFNEGVLNTQGSSWEDWSANGDLKVSQKSAGANMSVDIKTGWAIVETVRNAVTFKVFTESIGTSNLVITPNTSGSTRVDAVILRVSRTAVPNVLTNNVTTLEVIPGTSTSALSDGAITTAIGSDDFIRLADISVANGATSITNANITDTRTRVLTTDAFTMASSVLKFKVLASDPLPANLQEGVVWFNSTNHTLNYFNGTSVTQLGNIDPTYNPLVAVAQATPDMTLVVAKGTVAFGENTVKFLGGNSPTFTAPSTTNEKRIDLLCLSVSGALSVIQGTATTGTPAAPVYPVDKFVICEVYLRNGSTSIKNTDDSTNGYILNDIRPFSVSLDTSKYGTGADGAFDANCAGTIQGTVTAFNDTGSSTGFAVFNVGTIYTIAITSANTKYNVGDTITIAGPSATGVLAITAVTSTNITGVVSSVTSGAGNGMSNPTWTITAQFLTIAGTGTSFSSKFAVGSYLRVASTDYRVQTIASNTSLTTRLKATEAAISSGTSYLAPIDLGGVKVYVKNYTSINVTGTSQVIFLNPHENGTIIVFKSLGDVNITSTATQAIDLRNLGGLGGAANSAGYPGTGLINNPKGGTAPGAVAFVEGVGKDGKDIFSVSSRMINIYCGAGGGGGYSQAAGGTAGGRGAGAMLIACGGKFNFTGAINASGTKGVDSTYGGGGSSYSNARAGSGSSFANGVSSEASSLGGNQNTTGSGGGGGCFFAYYAALLANTGTVDVTGGVGGGGTSTIVGFTGGVGYSNIIQA